MTALKIEKICIGILLRYGHRWFSYPMVGDNGDFTFVCYYNLVVHEISAAFH